MQVSIIIYYLLSIYYLSICFGLPALWKNLDNSVRLGENSPAYLFPHQMRKLSEFPVNSNVSFSHVMRSMKVESTGVYQGIAGHLVWSDSETSVVNAFNGLTVVEMDTRMEYGIWYYGIQYRI